MLKLACRMGEFSNIRIKTRTNSSSRIIVEAHNSGVVAPWAPSICHRGGAEKRSCVHTNCRVLVDRCPLIGSVG